ncbi:MAG: hypothetical protein ACXADO_10020 [Candidatus Thorarchaeota archaeon]|jgi:hypothetical protein
MTCDRNQVALVREIPSLSIVEEACEEPDGFRRENSEVNQSGPPTAKATKLDLVRLDQYKTMARAELLRRSFNR